MDVTGIAWRKSRYSGSNGGACVEIGTAGPAVAVRDSKYPDGPLLVVVGAWKAFIEQVKATPEPAVSTGNAGAVPSDQKSYLARVSGARRPVDALP